MEGNNGNSGLAINNEVIARMVSVAALEVEGVAGMANRPASIKNIISLDKGSKSVRVKNVGGTISLDVYISVKENARLKDVAEAVQRSVKEKVQNMIGSAVTNVNVYVSDIEFAKPEEDQE